MVLPEFSFLRRLTSFSCHRRRNHRGRGAQSFITHSINFTKRLVHFCRGNELFRFMALFRPFVAAGDKQSDRRGLRTAYSRRRRLSRSRTFLRETIRSSPPWAGDNITVSSSCYGPVPGVFAVIERAQTDMEATSRSSGRPRNKPSG